MGEKEFVDRKKTGIYKTKIKIFVKCLNRHFKVYRYNLFLFYLVKYINR